MKRYLPLLLLLLLPGAPALAGTPKLHTTTTAISCTPNPVALNSASTCTVTVTDLGGQGPLAAPAGTVTFSSSGTGNFSAASCALAVTSASTSACSVTYTPTVFGSGTHTITANYGGGSDPNPSTGIVFNPSSGNVALALTYPTLTITSITPATGNRGTAVNVTISGTNFIAGATTLTLGANITVSALTVVTATQMTATLTIADAAATGFRNVTVTNPAPGGGSATLASGFEVRNPLPVIASLTPSAVEDGSGAVVVTIDGSGFVSDSIARFNGAARTTTFVNSTQLQISLLAGDTAVIGNYPITVVNAAPGGGTSNAATFSVVASGGSFDTVESGGALGSTMFTKRAGVAFTFDVLATEISRLAVDTGFTGTVKIELLDADDDSGALDASGCRASWSVVQTLANGTFTAPDSGRISATTSYAGALRIARFRVSYPAVGAATHIGCSSDAFSVRPGALALSTTLTNSATTGTPIHAAGATFSMTATGIAGYDGTPQVNVVAPGTVGGSFPAANPLTGVSTGNSFTYSEAGNFTVAAGGVFDSAFTAVDQPNDCNAGSSNTLSLGKYGCSFGTTAALTVGRFVPAYFDVTVVDACLDATGFTYSGQPFELTVTARNSTGGITQNYSSAAGFSKNVTLSDAGDASGFDGTTNVIAAADFANGTYTITDIEYTFPVAATTYTDITLRATDEDGVNSAGHTEETTEIRSGRLAVDNGTSITINDGLPGIHLQAWQETSPGVFEWAVHGDDTTCTSIAMTDFDISDAGAYSGNLSLGETTITGFFFNNGEGALTLSAPGTGNDGSVIIDVTIDDWLFHDWTGSGTPGAPAPEMTFFEIFETEPGFIHRQEVIP